MKYTGIPIITVIIAIEDSTVLSRKAKISIDVADSKYIIGIKGKPGSRYSLFLFFLSLKIPPEIFGFVMERLFEDGALDVIWIPISMKKNRPGTMIQVLCKESDRGKVGRSYEIPL